MQTRINTRTLTRYIVYSALMAALGAVLMYIKIPVPLMPTWLTINVSTIPALFAGYMMGPIWGVAVQGLICLIDLMKTTTGGIGQLADFLMGAALVFPATYIYWKPRTLKSALTGMGVGILCMVIAGVFANAYILMPMYMGSRPAEAIFGAAAKSNGAISNMATYLTYAVVPFNLIKGLLIAVITVPLYRRLEPMIAKRRAE